MLVVSSCACLPLDPARRLEKVGKELPTFSPCARQGLPDAPRSRPQDDPQRLAGIVVRRAARRGSREGMGSCLGMVSGATGEATVVRLEDDLTLIEIHFAG